MNLNLNEAIHNLLNIFNILIRLFQFGNDLKTLWYVAIEGTKWLFSTEIGFPLLSLIEFFLKTDGLE